MSAKDIRGSRGAGLHSAPYLICELRSWGVSGPGPPIFLASARASAPLRWLRFCWIPFARLIGSDEAATTTGLRFLPTSAAREPAQVWPRSQLITASPQPPITRAAFGAANSHGQASLFSTVVDRIRFVDYTSLGFVCYQGGWEGSVYLGE